ncbi:MAG: DUF5678 domain-containing protein [bacterium]|nr:DUF5678 domain-containing protein [bacterium]
MNLNNQKIWLSLEKYRGKWIALNEKEEKVIASSEKAKLAYQEAVQKGVKIPILFKVPTVFAPYVGSI